MITSLTSLLLQHKMATDTHSQTKDLQSYPEPEVSASPEVTSQAEGRSEPETWPEVEPIDINIGLGLAIIAFMVFIFIVVFAVSTIM